MKRIPQEARKAESKRKLVEAAMRLFSTKGYYETNSKEISAEAGLAVGSFYRHFTDKKDVVKYILDSYIRDAFPEADVSVDNAVSVNRGQVLSELIHRCFDMHQFSPGFYRQVTLLSYADREVGLVFNEYKRAVASEIREVIMKLAPGISEDIANAAGTIIYSAIEGSIHDVKFSQTELDEALLIKELVRFVDFYISGISSGA